jgi:exodeoxyribonuclease V gamma subunit
VPGVEKPRDVLVVHHPLQPFSPEHFNGVQPLAASHSERWCAAARAAIDGTDAPFIDTPLSAPDAGLRQVEVADLIRFLRDTAAHFLRKRLGLRLPGLEDAQSDDEPFVIEAGLERYALRGALLAGREDGQGTEEILATQRARGALPHGALGEQEALEQLEIIDGLLARQNRLSGTPIAPLEIDRAIGDFRLQGELRDLTDAGLVLSRPAKLKPKDRLSAWVQHLVLCALAPGGVALRTAYVAEDYTLLLSAVDEPISVLADLLDLYWEGLTHPVPFFPASSFAWFEKRTYEAVEPQWNGGQYNEAEGERLAVRIAFRGADPRGPAFEVCAQRVYQPIDDVSDVIKAGKES